MKYYHLLIIILHSCIEIKLVIFIMITLKNQILVKKDSFKEINIFQVLNVL